MTCLLTHPPAPDAMTRSHTRGIGIWRVFMDGTSWFVNMTRFWWPAGRLVNRKSGATKWRAT